MRCLKGAPMHENDNIAQARPVRWPFDPTRPLPLAVTFLSTIILVVGLAFFVQAMKRDNLALRLERPIATLVAVSEGERVLEQELSSWPGARILFPWLWTLEETERHWSALIVYFHQTDRQASESAARLARDVVLSRWGDEQARQRVRRADPTELETLRSRFQVENLGFDAEADAKLFVGLATTLALFAVVCLFLGIGILVLWLLRGKRSVVLHRDPGVGSFGLFRGYAVLSWGAVLGVVLIVLSLLGLRVMLDRPDGAEGLLSGFVTLIVGLPALVLIRRLLLGPLGVGYLDAFGLDPRPRVWRRLFSVTLVLFAVERSLELVIVGIGEMAGRGVPWYETIYEPLLYLSWPSASLEVADATIAAPIIEEIIFRGILYTSLRSRLKPLCAAVLSGVIFALVHGYGAAGLAALSAGATASALVYERTKSLIPCILSHSMGNFVSLGGNLLYRLV